MPSASVNGIDVYFERQGSGPPLLFLNGSGTTLATSGVVLAPFVGSFDVVAHDQRGLGRTSVPEGPYSMADYAADCIGLLDNVGWQTCRVVGLSFGGMVAQELAVTVPERIERLAVMCTSPGGSAPSYPLHELAAMPDAERDELAPKLLDTRFTPEWLAEHEFDALIAGIMADRTKAPRSTEQSRGERLQLEARSCHDVVDRLHRITCPTLVASGRYDGIAPPANGQAIASLVPNAQVRLYDGGHAFFAQDAAAFPEVVEFLSAD